VNALIPSEAAGEAQCEAERRKQGGARREVTRDLGYRRGWPRVVDVRNVTWRWSGDDAGVTNDARREGVMQ
jgi:hypothetical protein